MTTLFTVVLIQSLMDPVKQSIGYVQEKQNIDAICNVLEFG